MKRKNIVIAAAVAAVLAAAYPVGAWVIGSRIEAMHRRILDAQIKEVPYLKLVRHDYDRGIFSANETVVVEIPSAVLGLPDVPVPPAAAEKPQVATPGDAAAEGKDGEKEPAAQAPQPPKTRPAPPLRVTVKNAIRHGPLVDGGFNAAAVQSGIEFDGELQKKVLAAFDGKPPLDIRTRYAFDGSGQSTISSPPFRAVLPAGDGDPADALTLAGGGLEAAVEFTKDAQSIKGRSSVPSLELAGPPENGLSIKLTNLAGEIDQQRPLAEYYMFFIGKQNYKAAALEIDPGRGDEPPKPKIAMKDIEYGVDSRLADDFVDIAWRLAIPQLAIGESQHGPAALEGSAKHLAVRALAALNREIMSLSIGQAPEKKTEADVKRMEGQIDALLAGNPAFSIDRLSFRFGEQEARFSYSLTLPGAKVSDFKNPIRLAAKVESTAEAIAPNALIELYKQSLDEHDAHTLEEITAKLIDLGYATEENDALKTRLVFTNGQLLLNDKPFNPLSLLF